MLPHETFDIDAAKEDFAAGLAIEGVPVRSDTDDRELALCALVMAKSFLEDAGLPSFAQLIEENVIQPVKESR